MSRIDVTSSVYFDEKWKTECLQGDMSRADLIYVLEQLRFHNDGMLTIKIDKDARDYIVTALREL